MTRFPDSPSMMWFGPLHTSCLLTIFPSSHLLTSLKLSHHLLGRWRAYVQERRSHRQQGLGRGFPGGQVSLSFCTWTPAPAPARCASTALQGRDTDRECRHRATRPTQTRPTQTSHVTRHSQGPAGPKSSRPVRHPAVLIRRPQGSRSSRNSSRARKPVVPFKETRNICPAVG